MGETPRAKHRAACKWNFLYPDRFLPGCESLLWFSVTKAGTFSSVGDATGPDPGHSLICGWALVVGASEPEATMPSILERCLVKTLPDHSQEWFEPSLDSLQGVLTGGPAQPLVEALFALEPEHWLRKLPDRETFLLEEGGRRFVVKRLRRGAGSEGWYERIRGLGRRSPARRECENLAAMRADGLPVPRPLAWCADSRQMRSALVMEELEHVETLRMLFERSGAGERDHWIGQLVELVANLHDRGWYHRDLYLEHLVVTASGLALLDAGRVRKERKPRRRWFVKDLAALDSSVPRSVTRSERLRFLAGWLEARGLARTGELRRWTRPVLAKARRMRAHRPRHVDHESPRVPPARRTQEGEEGAGLADAS